MTKIKITNLSTADQAFNTVGGGTVVLEPGQSETVDLADRDSAQNKGREHAGVVKFGGEPTKEEKRENEKANPK